MTAAGSNWIEWNGGECPVGKGALVEVRWDDGTTTGPMTAGGWDWRNHGTPADIVAYRLVDAPGASTESALAAHPGGTHYSGATIQPAQFITANSLQFLEGCIVKRAFRHDKPTGKGREDVEKIIHEAQLLLELKYGVAA